MIAAVVEKLRARERNMTESAPVAVAFLGDSVTQGCFELVRTGEESFDTVFEPESAYANQFKRMVDLFFPRASVQIINAGISGDGAAGGARRLERDVLRFAPDLAVVSFGLNDCCAKEQGLQAYGENLREIFRRLRKSGAEVIFMSANGMNRYVDAEIGQEVQRRCGEQFARLQEEGWLRRYFAEACRIVEEEGGFACDCNRRWYAMEEAGADMTALLANHLNHPNRKLHWLFAASLFETVFF